MGATARQYSRAPISEAVIDLRVEPAEGTDLSTLEPIGPLYAPRYPTKKRLSVVMSKLQVGQEVSASSTSKEIGFRFESADGKQIVQAQVEGFTLSRLMPYESWEPFRDEARHLWEMYRDVVHPRKVSRAALRYINRLDIPAPLHDLRDFLRVVPDLPPELPQTVSGFFLHLTIPHEDLKSTLLLTQTFIDPPAPSVISVILDIDLSRTEDLPASEAGLWALLEELRVRKNEIFEACITDQTREMIR